MVGVSGMGPDRIELNGRRSAEKREEIWEKWAPKLLLK